MEEENHEMPDPADLYKLAIGDVSTHWLWPYIEVVVALRVNNHSWRSVSEWLEDKGIQASHTTLRNFYKEAWRTRNHDGFMDLITERAVSESEAVDPHMNAQHSKKNG